MEGQGTTAEARLEEILEMLRPHIRAHLQQALSLRADTGLSVEEVRRVVIDELLTQTLLQIELLARDCNISIKDARELDSLISDRLRAEILAGKLE